MPHEVIMPALGMAQDTGVIVCWRKEIGDQVTVGDALFDVETDKTTMEVEAAHAGFLIEIRANAGADIPVGQTIALIAEASGDAGLDLVSDTPKKPVAPIAPNPSVSQPPGDKPAALSTPSVAPTVPSTLSAVPILASPKAKFEAHRRGIDLRRLVDQGLPQPFHVADLDRLQPETAARTPLVASQLSATFEWSAFKKFVSWVEEKTDSRGMRQPTLGAFAAAAFRAKVKSGDAESLTILISSPKAKTSEIFLRDPDLQGLRDLTGSALKSGDVRADLTLIDLSGTRLVDYRPATQPGQLSIVITDNGSGEASVNLHSCEDDLPFLQAARFLDNFAARLAEPVLQLL